jgi:hypothetical protein
MGICSSKTFVWKKRFSKVMNSTPKIHSKSPLPHLKGREGKGGEKREGRRGSIPKIKFYDYSTGNIPLLQWPQYLLASPPTPACIRLLSSGIIATYNTLS